MRSSNTFLKENAFSSFSCRTQIIRYITQMSQGILSLIVDQALHDSSRKVSLHWRLPATTLSFCVFAGNIGIVVLYRMPQDVHIYSNNIWVLQTCICEWHWCVHVVARLDCLVRLLIYCEATFLILTETYSTSSWKVDWSNKREFGSLCVSCVSGMLLVSSSRRRNSDARWTELKKDLKCSCK